MLVSYRSFNGTFAVHGSNGAVCIFSREDAIEVARLLDEMLCGNPPRPEQKVNAPVARVEPDPPYGFQVS